MPASSDGVLFATSFCYPDRHLLRAVLELHPDHLELQGWGWEGRHQRTIPLDEVQEVQWWTGKGEANLGLKLSRDRQVVLQVESAGLWENKIRALAPGLDAHPFRAGQERAGKQSASQKRGRELRTKAMPETEHESSSATALGVSARVSVPADPALVESYAAAALGATSPPLGWRIEEVTLLALCGVLCGADDAAAIEVFLQSRAERLRALLPVSVDDPSTVRHTVPGEGTVTRLLETIQPTAFAQHLIHFQEHLAERLRSAGDGAAGHSHPRSQTPLGQLTVDAEGDLLLLRAGADAQGLRAPQPVLEAFDLSGQTVVAALAPGPREASPHHRLPRYARPHRLASQLAKAEARFLVALGSSSSLSEEVRARFQSAIESSPAGLSGRRCWAARLQEAVAKQAGEWPAFTTAAVIQETDQDGELIARQSYLGNVEADAPSILRGTRFLSAAGGSDGARDWHWKLAVKARREGTHVPSRGDAEAANVACLHDMAAALLQRSGAPAGDSSDRERRRQRAAWDDHYLLELLRQSAAMKEAPGGPIANHESQRATV